MAGARCGVADATRSINIEYNIVMSLNTHFLQSSIDICTSCNHLDIQFFCGLTIAAAEGCNSDECYE